MPRNPPSYRKHTSGQARVTLAGKDYYLGRYGSPESHESYARLIAEYTANQESHSFGIKQCELMMADVLLAFLDWSLTYYVQSSEHKQYAHTAKPIAELYGATPAASFGAAQFKALRASWLSDQARTRQYVNKQMQRSRRIVKWAVGEGSRASRRPSTFSPRQNSSSLLC